MITFNDVALLLEDPQGVVARAVTKHLEWPRSAFNPPRRTIDPKSRVQPPRWNAAPALKPNQFYNPVGATRWAMMLGLATDDQLNTITASLAGDYSGGYGEGAAGTLKLATSYVDPQKAVDVAQMKVNVTAGGVDGTFDLHAGIEAEMYLLNPLPVSIQADDETLWLLPFVDARYFWQQQTTLQPNSNTWQNLLANLSATLDANIVLDVSSAINTAYGIPDNCILGNGPINAAAALDLACWACNLRLVWLPKLGKYVLRSKATAPGLYDSQSNAQLNTAGAGGAALGGDWLDSLDGAVPYDIQFLFTNDTAQTLHSFDAQSEYVSIPEFAQGNPMTVWSPYFYNDAIESQLDGFARQWITDYYAWTKRRFWWCFPGMLDWHSTGFEDYVLHDMARTEHGQYAARTYVKAAAPWNGWDVVPCQGFGVSRTCGQESCRTIRFVIQAPLPGTLSCICAVEAVDAGFTLQDVPDLTNIEVTSGDIVTYHDNYQVIVCDPLCTFFNEPADALQGRRGWARYMQPLTPNTCQPDDYDLKPQWEVFSLNCLLNPIC